jgi:polysaccharide biosynthesis protein PslH
VTALHPEDSAGSIAALSSLLNIDEGVREREKAPHQLLFLCHRIPYPPDKGEKIRAFHILKHLAQTHIVHLGCLVDDPAEVIYLDKLRDLCASVGCFAVQPLVQKLRAIAGFRPGRPLTADLFRSPNLARWVAETLARKAIDRVFVFSSAMTEYVIEAPGSIRIFDMVDIDSEKWRAYAEHCYWPMAAVYRREARTLQALERRAALNFDTTLLVSGAEATRFAKLAPECGDRVGWLENGVDLEKFSPNLMFDRPFAKETINIVFTGTMSYWPNVDAVVWFTEHVLPKLRLSCVPIQFWVVGAKPNRRVLQLRRVPGVEVTGWVADVRPFLAHADVVVAPLRIARGTQNKVLEAMAMARPVVATSEAFEGLRVMAGQDLLVCDDSEKMAQRILEIVDGRYPGLGRAARLAVERHYRWTQTLRRLDDLFPSTRCLR